jgi:hypothetical protein
LITFVPRNSVLQLLPRLRARSTCARQFRMRQFGIWYVFCRVPCVWEGIHVLGINNERRHTNLFQIIAFDSIGIDAVVHNAWIALANGKDGVHNIGDALVILHRKVLVSIMRNPLITITSQSVLSWGGTANRAANQR